MISQALPFTGKNKHNKQRGCQKKGDHRKKTKTKTKTKTTTTKIPTTKAQFRCRASAVPN